MPPVPPSRQAQVAEILKCGKSPVYFIKTYTKIQHQVRGLIPFETYDFQDKCVEAFAEHRFNIVLKSRQLGLSTVTAAYALWMALFKKDKNILVIATKLNTAVNFIKKVKTMLDSLPPWLLLCKNEPTKQSIRFTNGSTITAIPTSPDAGRSEALALLIVDEAAFIRDFDEIWTGLAPTLSTGGSAIILSTPNGVGGQYYKLWTAASAGTNNFNPIKIPWWEHPEHDEEWFKKETSNLPKRKIAQEYLCVGGDARIVTPCGYKTASEIAPGDLVLTHMGRFRPVTRVASRHVADDEKLFWANSPGNRKNSFLITGNHPVLSYRFWANNESSLDHVRDNLTAADAQWIPVEEIAASRKTTDRIVNVLFPGVMKPAQTLNRIDVSQLHESVDVSEHTCRYKRQWGFTKRYVDVDFDLGMFVGLYLAEGCNCRGGFDMGFHKSELKTHVDWVVQYASSLGCRMNVNPSTSDNGCRLWSHNKHIGALLRSFVMGGVAHEKTLDIDRVMAAGPDFIRGLLCGHHAGDGNHTHNKKTCTYSTSSKLIYQLRTLNSIFGLYPRIGHVEHSKKNPLHHDMWYLEFQAEGTTYPDLLRSGQQCKKQSRTRYVNGHFIGNVRLTDASDLIQQDGGVEVYDISVSDDSSFVVESLVLHNCDFASSGDTFLQPTELEKVHDAIRQPLEKTGPQNGVWVWAKPQSGHRYVISADVARGDAADFSAFHVIDADTHEVAAEFMGKVAPDKLADLLLEYGKLYNEALLCPEQNTFGYFTCVRLRDMGYPRLYYQGAPGDIFEYRPANVDMVPGFTTVQKTRNQILAKLEELIRNDIVKTYSQRLYDQLQAFVWHGSKAMASKDSHDDLIMSIAIGLWLTAGESAGSEQAMSMAMAMLKATGKTSSTMNDLPGRINEVRPVPNAQITNYANSRDAYKPRRPEDVKHASVTDFSWLYR